VTDVAGNPLPSAPSWLFTVSVDTDDDTKCDPIDPCPHGGLEHLDACWFQGDWGESCTTVCTNRGLGYDPATGTTLMLGTVASANLCADLMAMLPSPPDPDGCGFDTTALYGGGRPEYGAPGCVAEREDCQRFGAPIFLNIANIALPVDPDSAETRIARACACK
jgi:hypothetical protein